ncbi:MAG: Rrf2 family transcriptional regulator [Olsenella sp.]
MDISRKTDYALRMIADLVRQPGSVVSVRSAAEENGVPYSFARSIQHELVRAGIIESLRGSHGGMKLAVDPREVTMLQVIEALQGPVNVAVCDTPERDYPCPNLETCRFNRIWCYARKLLEAYFGSISLADAILGADPARRPSPEASALAPVLGELALAGCPKSGAGLEGALGRAERTVGRQGAAAAAEGPAADPSGPSDPSDPVAAPAAPGSAPDAEGR